MYCLVTYFSFANHVGDSIYWFERVYVMYVRRFTSMRWMYLERIWRRSTSK